MIKSHLLYQLSYRGGGRDSNDGHCSLQATSAISLKCFFMKSFFWVFLADLDCGVREGEACQGRRRRFG